jgi:hypothetical protein
MNKLIIIILVYFITPKAFAASGISMEYYTSNGIIEIGDAF